MSKSYVELILSKCQICSTLKWLCYYLVCERVLALNFNFLDISQMVHISWCLCKMYIFCSQFQLTFQINKHSVWFSNFSISVRKISYKILHWNYDLKNSWFEYFVTCFTCEKRSQNKFFSSHHLGVCMYVSRSRFN